MVILKYYLNESYHSIWLSFSCWPKIWLTWEWTVFNSTFMIPYTTLRTIQPQPSNHLSPVTFMSRWGTMLFSHLTRGPIRDDLPLWHDRHTHLSLPSLILWPSLSLLVSLSLSQSLLVSLLHSLSLSLSLLPSLTLSLSLFLSLSPFYFIFVISDRHARACPFKLGNTTWT